MQGNKKFGSLFAEVSAESTLSRINKMPKPVFYAHYYCIRNVLYCLDQTKLIQVGDKSFIACLESRNARYPPKKTTEVGVNTNRTVTSVRLVLTPTSVVFLGG